MDQVGKNQAPANQIQVLKSGTKRSLFQTINTSNRLRSLSGTHRGTPNRLRKTRFKPRSQKMNARLQYILSQGLVRLA
ncbi:hypothetical protein AYI69_g6583 [Smittium culicis]|uniref:Uncharacterized protein n=1 Tax=Smittium culicis TaxID=133412 RepID=A0A1R1XYD5_9FUNG|nr:hypothetical protein AYI69_g6583 [Smittium culicis]